MKRLTAAEAAAFRRKIYAFYRRSGRSFPWRTTRDPYRILVSEIMLQQTQTKRVLPKYREFLRLFPNVCALARAPQKNVLRAWQGLGYNRRALSLHKAAKKMAAEHSGKVPHSYDELRALPGIGPYTAAAVRAFAFNKPGRVIETNIRSVFLHEFFPKKKKVADATLLPLIEATLDERNPSRWYSALMDYGAILKTLHGNAARRSAHYSCQPAFKGSIRALRGRILTLLLQKARTPRELARLLKEPETRVNIVLKALAAEGFVRNVSGKVRIA